MPPTNWRMTPSPPLELTDARLRRQVTGDQPHQRGLAGAVRPDQRGDRAVADPERHVVEQHPAVRQGVADVRRLDMAHDCPPSRVLAWADNSRMDPEAFNTNSRLRASDADRDRAASVLNEALAEGRLTAEEHSERLDTIYAAKTHAEIVPVIDDLPARADPAAQVAAPGDGGHRQRQPRCVAVFGGVTRKGTLAGPGTTTVPDRVRRRRARPAGRGPARAGDHHASGDSCSAACRSSCRRRCG